MVSRTPARFIKQTPMHTPRPKYIIIHNANCLMEYNNPKTDIDSKKQQYQFVKFDHVIQLKLSDVNYHFILDRLGNDYEIFVGKPFHTLCIFEDIQDVYLNSIHVAVMGDYNKDMAGKRLYEVLAYRLLVPLLYWFNLDKNNIKLHSEVSSEEIECPGDYFFKEILLDAVTRFKNTK